MSKKTVKAWVCVAREEPSLNWHENRPMIYPTRAEARFNAFEGDTAIPCTITYTLPTTTRSPKKK